MPPIKKTLKKIPLSFEQYEVANLVPPQPTLASLQQSFEEDKLLINQASTILRGFPHYEDLRFALVNFETHRSLENKQRLNEELANAFIDSSIILEETYDKFRELVRPFRINFQTYGLQKHKKEFKIAIQAANEVIKDKKSSEHEKRRLEQAHDLLSLSSKSTTATVNNKRRKK